MFRMYELENMDYVGKQESLTDNLVTALTLAGEKFNENLLRSISKSNKSSSEFINKSKLSKELENRIIASERWVIGEFYD